MKKALSLLICLIMTFLIFTVSVPVAFAAEYSGTCGSDITWTLDTFSGELVINGSGDMNDYSYDSSPSWAFYQSYVKSVTFGEGITSVGAYAFYNQSGYRYNKMTTVNLSSTIDVIDEYAFRGCKAITTVSSMSGVQSIGSYAFRSCTGLTVIDLGDSITQLGNGSFSLCSSLESISFPSSLKTIGAAAFEGCSSITELTIPSTVTTLGNSAFADCSGITDILFSASSITSEIYGAFVGAGAPSGMSVVFDSNITTIPIGLFDSCTNLTSVTLGSGVKTIRERAFYATSLTDFNITPAVTSVDGSAFAYCNNLTAFTVDSSNTTFAVGTKGELLNYAKTILYRYPSGRTETTYAAVAAIKTIATGAFWGDDDLESVTSVYVTSIEAEAFQECTNLSKIVFGRATSVGVYAFADCNKLSTITAPYLKTLGNFSFFGCDSLENIDDFTAVTTIGDYAFSNCQGLTDVTCPSTLTSIGGYAFVNSMNIVTVSFNEGLISIGTYAFSQCPGITEATIPSTVTSIGSYAIGYVYSNGSYVPAAGFKIYCYSGTAGYSYASGGFTYEVVTDSIQEEIVIPEQEENTQETEFDIFGFIMNIIKMVVSFVIELI